MVGGSPVASESLAGDWPSTITSRMVAEELTIAGYEASDAGEGMSDPVVKYLVEQHSLRKAFPAKHLFSMTTEVSDGRIVSVATCMCKQVFKFGSNDTLRIDAAIEAHQRRFSHQATVDGRGEPIGTGAAKSKKPRKRKEPGAGGHPAPIEPAPALNVLCPARVKFNRLRKFAHLVPLDISAGAKPPKHQVGEVTASLPKRLLPRRGRLERRARALPGLVCCSRQPARRTVKGASGDASFARTSGFSFR